MNSQIPLQLTPITDPEEVQRLESLIQDIVDKPDHLDINWLINRGWVAVPVESASHFSESDAEKLSQAIQSISCEKCFAIATEPLMNFHHCFQVPTTSEGLLDFSWTCSHFNFVLVSEDKSFAVLCTISDYFIIAGTLEFVKHAVSGNIEAARSEFNRFASSNDRWKGRLLAVSKRYEEFLSSGS